MDSPSLRIMNNLIQRMEAFQSVEPSQTITDLEVLINFEIEAFQEAVEKNVLGNYLDLTEGSLTFLKRTRQNLINSKNHCEKLHLHYLFPAQEFTFDFNIYIHDKPAVLEKLNQKISQLEFWQMCFINMQNLLIEYIKLEVLPTNLFYDGKKIYLPQGKIILPKDCSEERQTGYLVFNYDYSQSDAAKEKDGSVRKKQIFSFFQKYSSSKLEKVIEQLKKKISLFESIVVARNTENYPLLDTILPLVEKKLYRVINSNQN